MNYDIDLREESKRKKNQTSNVFDLEKGNPRSLMKEDQAIPEHLVVDD